VSLLDSSLFNLAPPRLQRGVSGSEFVTHHPISIKIFVIHFVPALSSDDMFYCTYR